VARFHVIPVADIEPSEGNEFIQLGERCGARGWKNHRGTWLANGTAQGGIFTGNSRGHHPTEPCPKGQSEQKDQALRFAVYGTLLARTLARSSLANPRSDPIPLSFLGLKPGLPSVGSFPLFPTAITTSGVNSTPPYVLFEVVRVRESGQSHATKDLRCP